MAVNGHLLSELPKQLLRKGGRRPLIADIGTENHEFIAPEAGHRVAVTNTLTHSGGNPLNQGIADFVAQTVVHAFELVQIQQQHRELGVLACRLGNGMFQPVPKQVTVWQPGQVIVIGLILQRRLIPFPVSHIIENADEMRNLALFVMDCGKCYFIPEQTAVFPVVSEDGSGRAAMSHAVAQPFQSRLGQIVSQQEAGAQTDDLVVAVAGHDAEGAVGVDDRVVPCFISQTDHNAVAAFFDCPVIQLQFAGPALQLQIQAAVLIDPASHGCVRAAEPFVFLTEWLVVQAIDQADPAVNLRRRHDWRNHAGLNGWIAFWQTDFQRLMAPGMESFRKSVPQHGTGNPVIDSRAGELLFQLGTEATEEKSNLLVAVVALVDTQNAVTGAYQGAGITTDRLQHTTGVTHS